MRTKWAVGFIDWLGHRPAISRHIMFRWSSRGDLYVFLNWYVDTLLLYDVAPANEEIVSTAKLGVDQCPISICVATAMRDQYIIDDAVVVGVIVSDVVIGCDGRPTSCDAAN